MKFHILLLGLVLIPFTLSCSPIPPAVKQGTVQVRPEKRKKLVSATYCECVRIDGVLYTVPRQWRGRKVHAPPLTFPELSRIPKELTYQESSLYIGKAANQALQAMAAEAAEDDVWLQVHSAYRSTGYQRKIFQRFLAQGRDFDDVVRYVAPPGYSQHALGTVVDFYPSNWSFAETETYRWLKENASRFHFVESYPRHKPEGLPWESWHWRWVPEDKGR